MVKLTNIQLIRISMYLQVFWGKKFFFSKFWNNIRTIKNIGSKNPFTILMPKYL